MVPRVYMDPMNCSPNGTNIYVPTGQPMLSAQQQQTSPTFPMFYSSSPPTPLTPWMPTAAPPPPYFMLSNPQQAQPFPFQQLI
jgi:hypothetical protein